VTYTALLDANVLHPMVLCDLLIRLSQHGLYRARWSRRILDEVVRSVIRRRADLSPSKLERRIDMMNQAVADAEVEESEELIEPSASSETMRMSSRRQYWAVRT
jgi:hypothetical protein